METDAANYYRILGVAPSADFAALRKAYRRRAMACHPDRFGGDPAKEGEFKRLVEAFNVLSDPRLRRQYDEEHETLSDAASATAPVEQFPEDANSILDTFADDILEELIVGNSVPKNMTLQTLMLNLKSTERFLLFREGKNLFYARRIGAAKYIFSDYVERAPMNILAHYYLARCCIMTHDWDRAEKEYRVALRLGAQRVPPLRMRRIRHELARLRHKRPGLLAGLRRLFFPAPKRHDPLTSEERERRALHRAINRMAKERPLNRRKPRPSLEGKRES